VGENPTVKIIDRYIGRTVALGILMSLGVILGLLVLFTFIDELDDVGDGQYGVLQAFAFALLSIPRFVFEAFPASALIGSLIGLGGLASHSELTAMRAAGVSVRQILFAILKAGLPMMAVVIVLGEWVAPPVQDYANRMRMASQDEQVTLRSRYGFWARDGDAFINIRQILPGQGLRELYLYEFDEHRELRLVTQAERADFVDGGWVLLGLRQAALKPDGVQVRTLEEARWDSLLSPSLLKAVVADPSLLSAWALYQYLEFMQQNGLHVPAYEVAFWSKVVAPIATLVMLFLGVPFVFGNLRSVGVGQRVFVGVLIGTLFFMLNRGLAYAAVVYDFNPLVAATLPALLFMAAGAVFLRRVR
jgi:lipopolysaccharide export system permease protein